MVKIVKLSCKTTLVMEKTDYVQSAALGIWVKAGAADESNDVSGVSHFIEHMMFKGTDKRTAKEIASDVDKIGGMFNAFTGKEATCYYIKTLSSNIYQGAEILIDMITGSRFDSEEMDKERQVIFEEIKMVKDSPDDDVYDTISELVSSGNPLGRSILGTPESLSGIDRGKLTGYLDKKYARDSIVIAVSGNFDEERIKELFEEKLNSLRENKITESFEMKPYKQSFDVKVRDIEQTHICMAIPGVSLADERYYAFVLMNSILGGSMSSRLFQNIREEKGLAYSVCSMNVFSSYWGFFSIYAGVAHEKAKDTIEAIKYELQQIKEKGVTEEELAMAKEQVKSSYIFGLENINSRMFSIGKNQLLLNKVFTAEEVLGGFDAVTGDDILKAAEIIGDCSAYCGASVTGKDFDLEGMMRR
ncbi:MAG: pitrilysin family protein [Anaerovoracaceae bacterium]|nr:pitrilysin family protein [Anaerovoracaceae bacterium]